MPSNRPKSASALPSPLANPSAITRDSGLADAGAHAGAHVRAYTRAGAGAQVPAVAGRGVETAAQALAAALVRVGERREALAAAVAVARASGLSDAVLRARLVIAGLDQADVDDALA